MRFKNIFIILVVVVLNTSVLLAQDSVGEYREIIRESIQAHETKILDKLTRGMGNDQFKQFEPLVNRLSLFLESQDIDRLVKTHSLDQYRNLAQNHLLHISLIHQIDSYTEISDMYPHELPFKHSGAFPAYPTLEAIKKVDMFLATLEFKKVDLDFQGLRRERSSKFLLGFKDKPEQDKKWLSQKIGNGKENIALDEVIDLEKEDIRINDIEREYNLNQESKSIERIVEKPIDAYKEYAKRIKTNGLNASFPEFEYVVKNLELSIEVAKLTEKAILIEPKLANWRSSILKDLGLVAKNGLGYRETLSTIMEATEFLDIVQRTVNPKETNPLHYAKRYEYYMHYMLGLAPKHFTIPSSFEFKTYDLLAIGGASIGFAGISYESLWVDSYNQTSNEFTIHDTGNHERRRYQFTRNYAFQLGLTEKQIPAFREQLDKYNRTYLLPMIKRINPETLSSKMSIDQIKENIPGAEYFAKELGLFDKNTLNLESLVTTINEKKDLLDLLLFEVVHEDALPPSPKLIIESIMRPPNVLMPRDFIDPVTKVAHHAMEKSGSTMSYMIHKLNGSFYDTPEKRMESLIDATYRSPRKIIEMSAELIENLGGHEFLSVDEVLEQLAYLTITDEGFLSYLVEEFQKDLHPIQKKLNMSLKYAEALEVLSLVGLFETSDEFEYYLKILRKKIELSIPLSDGTNVVDLDSVLKSFERLDDGNHPEFEKLQEKYFKLADRINQKIYSNYSKSRKKVSARLKERYANPDKELRKIQANKNKIVFQLSSSVDMNILPELESLHHEEQNLEKLILNNNDVKRIKARIIENQELWNITYAQDVDVSIVEQRVMSELHDNGWLKVYRNEHGVKEYYRKLPSDIVKEGETIESTLVELEKKYSGLKIDTDNELVQNINTESRNIVPELFELLIGKASKAYVYIVLRGLAFGEDLTPELIDILAGDIHDQWMELNRYKIERNLLSLGHDVYKLSVKEIQEIVSKLEYKHWQGLTAEEARTLKLFTSYGELSKTRKGQISKDALIAVNIVETLLTETYLKSMVVEFQNSWEVLSSKTNIEKLSQVFSDSMHDSVWLKNHQLTYGEEPQYKELPQNVTKSFKTLKKQYKGLKSKDGKVFQDINRNAIEIIPELKELLTKEIATKYIRSIIEYRSINPEFSVEHIKEIASNFHNIFMQHNKWQLKEPMRKLGFDINRINLTKILAIIGNIEKSQWKLMSPKEIRKIKQFVKSDKLGWVDFKKDVQMVSLLLRTHSVMDCETSYTPQNKLKI